jgi:hypothetical protein
MTHTSTETYPKFRPIPRLHRRVIATEKINGTNGLIDIVEADGAAQDPNIPKRLVFANGTAYAVRAGSRNRWLSPENDNFGFAAWVWANAEGLVALGVGKHYGEWFGSGIQTGYGLSEKRFALFNVDRWYDVRDPEIDDRYTETFPKAKPAPPEVTVVPVISVFDGQYLNAAVDDALHTLESEGSLIAPGFMDPEGIILFHVAAGSYFKVTIKGDEKPKSQVKASK